MPYPRVIPHSDGAGQVDLVGDGVARDWLGKSVWCYGAQSYRPFGTVAEFTVVPAAQAVPLPANVTMEQGACLGIPGMGFNLSQLFCPDWSGSVVTAMCNMQFVLPKNLPRFCTTRGAGLGVCRACSIARSVSGIAASVYEGS
ncbi:alcohol dehydrogenase catalytic domain-containing protein [Edaphobacter aggregans]|uniref:alcohol dehydrogenase catalytic domain-containing protein n=1 Tax=Edaphobacter aggregans TaxID=570835 RepID=UPI0026ADC83E